MAAITVLIYDARMADGIWQRDTSRRYTAFKMSKVGHWFHTSIEHGGGWSALHYGPRGGVKGAEAFYGPERARHCREWCEARARKLK